MKPKSNRKPGKMDNCQTPPYAIQPLVPYLRITDRIWEPAAGEGLMETALTPHVHSVVGTDIVDGVDFFHALAPMMTTKLITNPPYSMKPAWVKQCIHFGLPWALLMPAECWFTAGIQDLVRTIGMEVIICRQRVNFKMPVKGWDSRAQFPVAWFTWGFGIGAPVTYFGNFEKGDYP